MRVCSSAGCEPRRELAIFHVPKDGCSLCDPTSVSAPALKPQSCIHMETSQHESSALPSRARLSGLSIPTAKLQSICASIWPGFQCWFIQPHNHLHPAR